MYAGIDVSKNWVDVAVEESGERLERASPLKAAKWLKKRKVTLVALEATGGYELPMLHALSREKIDVARANPRCVRQFAQACGKRAKTDRGDAALLARYAKVIQPQPVSLPAKALTALRALCLRRQDLVAMRTQERNRRQQATEDTVLYSIDRVLEGLDSQITSINAAIIAHFSCHPDLDATRRRLCTMPGVGPVTAAMLIAQMPELGHASRTEIAALAGVAPFTRESGTWKGKSFCSGGRAPVRSCLYMAALSATNGENPLAQKYQSLRGKGKPTKVALVAIMRKMIITLNTMIRKQIDFNPNIILDS